MKKIIIFASLFLLLIFLLLINIRPRPEVLTTNLVKKKELLGNAALTVQFLGNTNLVISDGETTLITDGFFSRPSVLQLLNDQLEPSEDRIRSCLNHASLANADVVIPLHSHFDHVMDAPFVADVTGAVLLGSSSSLNVGKGYGLSDDQMQLAPLNQKINIGKFKLTFIASEHWQYPDEKQRLALLDQDINEPLLTPASLYDYKEGISYTLLLEHDSIKIAIQGSAGFKENSIPNFDADILFVSIAGLETMDQEYNDGFQKHLIEAVSPQTIIPIHWDDFTVPLSTGLKTTHVLFNWKYGTNLSEAFQIIESNNPNREIKILPLWEEIEIKNLY